MGYAKIKTALGLTAAIILAGGATTAVLSGDEPSDHLSPGDISKRAQEKYASLTSYSDEGKTVAALNGMTITTTFTIRLARPKLYRIEWEQDNGIFKMKPQIVWSAGEDDFLDMGRGAEKKPSQKMALASATGISGGAAATVPSVFFKMNWGNPLAGAALGGKRDADDKVGDVDCYVLTSELGGLTRTLWIGKQDFLIHQSRNVTSAEAMKAALAEAAKGHPEFTAPLPPGGLQGVTSTETHTNIVLNPKLTAADFAR